MVDRDRIFGIAGRVELATEHCDLSCDWCGLCRGCDLPADALERIWSSDLRPGTPSLRVRGGDPFRYADLDKWVGWARRQDVAAVVEGPAASLAGDDSAAIVARLLAAAPDAVSAALPTVDATRSKALTGTQWDPARALDSLAELAAAGLAIEVVFPVHPTTVRELPAVVGAVAERLGNTATITLRRSPTARDDRAQPPLIDGRPDWPELDALSEAVAALPDKLPGGARLQVDPALGYAACLLSAPAQRPDLFPAQGRGGKAPLGDLCAECAWAAHCTFRADLGTPPPSRVRPLTRQQARTLDHTLLSEIGAEPHRFHTDRASVGLPEFLCFAPWTTLSICEPRYHAVPCALSWVETTMTPEQLAAAGDFSVEEEREHEHTIHAEIDTHTPWYVTDNPRLSLMDLWNSPLLRLMRREMTGGEKSSRCRAMCRVVMGVEERGVSNFQRPAAELTPEIVANRHHLLEEIHAHKNVLSAKPLDLMMGVSAHCNISCGFCDGPLGQYGDLTDRRRDEIIDLLPTLMSFGVSGPGEPLMNKNFLALLAHISDVGYPALFVSLTTNGTLLTPEFLARTHNVPWGSVRISLNSGSAETYQRMTGKDYFDRIMRNLDALCGLREKATRRFSITLSLVLGSVQMGDLAKFAKIVDDHRTAIILEPMNDDKRNLSPWVRPEKLAALADELHQVGESYVDRNPDIARAFRAVEGFARTRLAHQDFRVLEGH